MSDILEIDRFRSYFSKVTTFTIDDIVNFYSPNKPIVRETIKWRIHRLSKMGLIHNVGRGVYSLGQETIFIPQITKPRANVYKVIAQNYPYAEMCVWHTSSLNEFMLHQPGKFSLIVEVEKTAVESVFYFIKERYKDVFINPKEDIVRNYIAGKKETIIVKTLISDAPIQSIYNIKTPTIEKILVDVFCDTAIFSAFQGHEKNIIFSNAFTKYTVNLSTLYRYAERRGKRIEIENYIQQIIK